MGKPSHPEIFILFERGFKPIDIIRSKKYNRQTVYWASRRWKKIRIDANTTEIEIEKGKVLKVGSTGWDKFLKLRPPSTNLSL